MYSEDFEFCEYAKASALRIPLRDAINSARAMPEAKMDQVVKILETALSHIKGCNTENEVTVTKTNTTVTDDPLDLLLGSVT
jgi:hypothetical protein